MFLEKEDTRVLDKNILFVFNFESGSRFWLKTHIKNPLWYLDPCHTPHLKHDAIFITYCLRSLNVKSMFWIDIKTLYDVLVLVLFVPVSCFKYCISNVLCYSLLFACKIWHSNLYIESDVHVAQISNYSIILCTCP